HPGQRGHEDQPDGPGQQAEQDLAGASLSGPPRRVRLPPRRVCRSRCVRFVAGGVRGRARGTAEGGRDSWGAHGFSPWSRGDAVRRAKVATMREAATTMTPTAEDTP